MLASEDWMFPCMYKKLSGMDCPGCGFQRSLERLINGDLSNSFDYYPPLIPVLIMCLFLVAHLVYNFRNGAGILKWMFIVNSVIITVNYIFKFI